MKKILAVALCLALFSARAACADSWNDRKARVKSLLKSNNLTQEDRFELVYAQKITDRMANHFAYILKDNKTGMEYLLYTVNEGDSTKISNMAIAPLLEKPQMMPHPAVPVITPEENFTPLPEDVRE